MRDFLSQCLVMNPLNRKSYQQLLAHPWLRPVEYSLQYMPKLARENDDPDNTQLIALVDIFLSILSQREEELSDTLRNHLQQCHHNYLPFDQTYKTPPQFFQTLVGQNTHVYS